MSTFAFKPYTYVPTAPHRNSAVSGRKLAPKQASNLNKLQQISSSGTAATIAVANTNGSFKAGIQGSSIVYGGSHDENEDDDCDFPSIEELFLHKLQEPGFAMEDRGINKSGGVEWLAAEDRGASADQSRASESDNSGGSPNDPIFLVGKDDSSSSAAEAYDVHLRAKSTELDGGLFDSPENAVGSTTPGPPCSSDGWHDIENIPSKAPRLQLAKQGAATSNPISPRTSSSRLLSEPVHDCISTEGSQCAKVEGTASSSTPPSHNWRTSPGARLNQEGCLHIDRGLADERLAGSALDTFPVDEGPKEQRPGVEQEDSYNCGDVDEGPQQEANVVAPTETAKRFCKNPRLANPRQSTPNLEPSPKPSHNKAGSQSDLDSNDELSNSDNANKDARPLKRKRPSSCYAGLTRKKPSRDLHQRQLSKPHRQYPKSQSPLAHKSRVATSSITKGRLLSPAPCVHQSMDTTMPLDDPSLGRSSGATPPTLTEITFRPHSTHCYSFTATVQDGCDGQGLSLGQVVQLIASIGHVGKIDDFTIKPVEQHSYLLSGFSRHTSLLPSLGRTTPSTTAETGRNYVDVTCTRLQGSRAVDTGGFSSRRSEPSSSDNDEGGSSDSDTDLGDEYSSKDEPGHAGTRTNVSWSRLDELRLLAYKKEDKDWDWILTKFPGRTESAVRQRVSIARNRGK